MNIYHHSGDIGDVIASMPVMRELGDGKLIISETSYPPGKNPARSMRGKRFEALQPMWEAAPYVTSIEWQDQPKGVTHDIGRFRMEAAWTAGETLYHWQGRAMKVNLPEAPQRWLHVEVPYHDMIVIGRTARYHTPHFPWRLIVEKFHNNLLFLGLPEEYKAFREEFGKVEYQLTKDLLEATKIIAGSKLFIGNQSVLFWIAAGLAHHLIQETFHQIYSHDSIVPRRNALYVNSAEDLLLVHTTLGLSTDWLKKYNFPISSRVNLTTSAGDPRKNLTTSAEIFELLNS
jgi:hypothetical protein